MSARSIVLLVCILATLAISIFVPLYYSSTINNPGAGQSDNTSSSTISYNVTTSVTTSYDPIISSSSSSTIVQPKMAIPLYSESLSDWYQVFNTSSNGRIVVLNANYGPGSAYDPTYALIAKLAQQTGTTVLGYVYTNYADGSIPVSEVEQWISDWYNWYHVDGIFFDEVQSTCTNQSIQYYTALYNYTKSEPGSNIVVLNPGNPIGACYGPISDIIVTFEGNYADYLSNYDNASWTSYYPASHFWHIVYNATTLAQMQYTIQLASQRRAGWIYVTDGLAHNVNALGRLPIYLCQEAQYLDPVGNSCQANTTSTNT